MHKRLDELKVGDRIFFNEAGRKEAIATVVAVALLENSEVKLTLDAWGERRSWQAGADQVIALAFGGSEPA